MTPRPRTAVPAPSTDPAYEPPAATYLEWCPECGRTDRFNPFTGKRHFRPDGLCPGTPQRLTYTLARAGSPDA